VIMLQAFNFEVEGFDFRMGAQPVHYEYR
jgi:hypothetical protein